MENSTQIMSFILTAYGEIGNIKYLYFTIILVLYLSMVCANTLVIGVICAKRSLHEPMYFMLCSLFANEIYGCTSVFPCLMTQMFSDTHEVPFFFCIVQVFSVYAYVSIEYCNLAIMSYDRYVAICYPLHYSYKMSTKRLCVMLSLVYIFSFLKCAFTMVITVNIKFCGNSIDKLFCDPNKLLCSVETTKNTLILVIGIVTFFVPMIPISFSYINILSVCLKHSKADRRKSIKTCSLHLISLSNFVLGLMFEMIQAKFNIDMVPKALRIFLSTYLMICQPLLSPIMYGLSLTNIRDGYRKFLVFMKLKLLQDGFHGKHETVNKHNMTLTLHK